MSNLMSCPTYTSGEESGNERMERQRRIRKTYHGKKLESPQSGLFSSCPRKRRHTHHQTRNHNDTDEDDEGDWGSRLYRGTQTLDIRSSTLEIPLISVSITASVVHAVAQVQTVQVYRNQGSESIEGFYYFPIDSSNGAVCHFQAEVDGKVIQGGLGKSLQWAEVRQIAKPIKKNLYVFVGEEDEPDVFKVSIGCLQPGSEVKLTIGYVTGVKNEPNTTASRFHIPIVSPPRYNTENYADAFSRNLERHTNYVQAALSIKVIACMPQKIGSILSPTHEIVSEDKGEIEEKPGWNKWIAQLDGDTTGMDKDFVILINPSETLTPRLYSETLEDGSMAVMAHLVPSFKLEEQKVELIVLIDTSCSMIGESFEMARKALTLILHTLPTDCYFNIHVFGDTFNYCNLFPMGSVKYNDETLRQAIIYAEVMQANLIGTDILKPMGYIYAKPTIEGYHRQVIVITDGQVGEADVFGIVKHNAHTTRVFALGVGKAPSHYLIEGIAQAGGGTCAFLGNDENFEKQTLSLISNALQPAITNVKVEWQGVPENVPRPLNKTKSLIGYNKPLEDSDADEPNYIQGPCKIPPVFDGSQMVILAVFENKKPTGVKITADSPDGPLVLEFELSEENDLGKTKMLHRLAAIKRVRELEKLEEKKRNIYSAEGRLYGQTAKTEIQELAVKARISSKDTLFIAVEDCNSEDNWMSLCWYASLVAQRFERYGLEAATLLTYWSRCVGSDHTTTSNGIKSRQPSSSNSGSLQTDIARSRQTSCSNSVLIETDSSSESSSNEFEFPENISMNELGAIDTQRQSFVQCVLNLLKLEGECRPSVAFLSCLVKLMEQKLTEVSKERNNRAEENPGKVQKESNLSEQSLSPLKDIEGVKNEESGSKPTDKPSSKSSSAMKKAQEKPDEEIVMYEQRQAFISCVIKLLKLRNEQCPKEFLAFLEELINDKLAENLPWREQNGSFERSLGPLTLSDIAKLMEQENKQLFSSIEKNPTLNQEPQPGGSSSTASKPLKAPIARPTEMFPKNMNVNSFHVTGPPTSLCETVLKDLKRHSYPPSGTFLQSQPFVTENLLKFQNQQSISTANQQQGVSSGIIYGKPKHPNIPSYTTSMQNCGQFKEASKLISRPQLGNPLLYHTIPTFPTPLSHNPMPTPWEMVNDRIQKENEAQFPQQTKGLHRPATSMQYAVYGKQSGPFGGPEIQPLTGPSAPNFLHFGKSRIEQMSPQQGCSSGKPFTPWVLREGGNPIEQLSPEQRSSSGKACVPWILREVETPVKPISPPESFSSGETYLTSPKSNFFVKEVERRRRRFLKDSNFSKFDDFFLPTETIPPCIDVDMEQVEESAVDNVMDDTPMTDSAEAESKRILYGFFDLLIRYQCPDGSFCLSTGISSVLMIDYFSLQKECVQRCWSETGLGTAIVIVLLTEHFSEWRGNWIHQLVRANHWMDMHHPDLKDAMISTARNIILQNIPAHLIK